MKKPPKKGKVVRLVKRARMPTRTTRARIAYLKPDPSAWPVVKVFISPNRRHMRTQAQWVDRSRTCARTQGQVFSWQKGPRRRAHLVRGRIVARMYLNVDDLKAEPAELMAHECAHAGMAWARWRRVDLTNMEHGEEVLCYAVGRMMTQLNNIAYKFGVFG
ncbi:MAG: hypothetical protein V4857_14325 [Pseudomonadota bacterium]